MPFILTRRSQFTRATVDMSYNEQTVSTDAERSSVPLEPKDATELSTAQPPDMNAPEAKDFFDDGSFGKLNAPGKEVQALLCQTGTYPKAMPDGRVVKWPIFGRNTRNELAYALSGTRVFIVTFFVTLIIGALTILDNFLFVQAPITFCERLSSTNSTTPVSTTYCIDAYGTTLLPIPSTGSWAHYFGGAAYLFTAFLLLAAASTRTATVDFLRRGVYLVNTWTKIGLGCLAFYVCLLVAAAWVNSGIHGEYHFDPKNGYQATATVPERTCFSRVVFVGTTVASVSFVLTFFHKVMADTEYQTGFFFTQQTGLRITHSVRYDDVAEAARALGTKSFWLSVWRFCQPLGVGFIKCDVDRLLDHLLQLGKLQPIDKQPGAEVGPDDWRSLSWFQSCILKGCCCFAGVKGCVDDENKKKQEMENKLRDEKEAGAAARVELQQSPA